MSAVATSSLSSPLTKAWTEREAADFLGVSVRFLQRDRMTAKRIPFFRIGKRCVYDPLAVSAYRERCKVGGGQ